MLNTFTSGSQHKLTNSQKKDMAKSSKTKTVEPSVTQLEQDKKSPFKKYYYFFGIITFLLFVNTLGHGYNLDDTLVTNNHPLTSKGLSAIGEIFNSSYYSDNLGYAYGYRPIVHLSFALEHDLFGQSPGAGHFINVVLFILCVLLFFKLLLKWFGEKNLIFIAIATLIFAVHPIHTEVVNSLKNRDELLAFLFIISAGLCLHKYIEKGKITSLIGILLYTILAMLSKKSAYPLTILLPIIQLILVRINLKQLIISSAILIIPAAIIGADATLNRTILMIVLPAILISLTYYLTQKSDQNAEIKSNNHSIIHWLIPTVATIATFTFYYFSYSQIALLASFVCLIWTYKNNYKVAIYLSIFMLYFIPNSIPYINNNHVLLYIASAFSAYLYTKNEKLIIWLPYFLLGSSLYFINAPSILSLLYILAVSILSYLAFKKQLLALLFTIILIATFYFITKEVSPFVIVVLTSILILYFKNKKPQLNRIVRFIPIVVIGSILLLQTIDQVKNRTYNDAIIASETGSVNNLGNTSSKVIDHKKTQITEGRQLQYVENTLVVKHTAEEKIATGFYTLGEYLKLQFYPIELSFYYGYSKIKTVDFSSVAVWISLILHLAFAFIGISLIKKRPMITIGVLWYFASILLFSNWVELVAGMVGERLAFTASAGFALFIAGIIAWIAPKLEIKKLGIAGIAVLGISVIFAGRTLTRNTHWKNTYTLMNHDIAHLENSAQANNMYAMTLMGLSNPAIEKNQNTALSLQNEAIQHFEKALLIAPDYFNVYVNLGRAAMITQSYDKAISAFNNAVKIEPQFYASYNHLLEIYQHQKDHQKYAQTAKQLFDVVKEPRTYILYAMSEYQLGNKDKSREILEEGLKVFPADEAILQNLNALN